MKYGVALTIASLAGFFFAACQQQAEPVAVASQWPSTKNTDGGNFSVILAPSEEIKENKHFSLDVEVKPAAAGGQAAGMKVVVNADMPGHGHGMNTQPQISSTKPNHYRVDGMLFHMAGQWVINVDITNGAVTEKALFPVVVE